MQLFDQVIFPDNMRNDISGSTFILEQGGHIHAVLGDTASGGAVGYELAANGLISSMISYDLPIHVGDSGPVIATSAQGYIYTMTAEGQLQGFREEPGGYRAVTSHIDTAASYANDPVALEVVSSGGVEYLIVLCGTDVGISAFGIDPQTGTLSHVSAVGTNTGVGLLSNPTDMQTVIIGDATYILVTSAAEGGQAGALTVVELGPDGEMQVTDHILDSRDTRFGSAHTLEITQVGGWTYVVTGGGDAGLSLFALMPMGRLLHLDTIEDTISAGLETISALSLFAAANTLHVFAASQASQGLAQLSVDLSQQGQVLEVGAGRLDGQGRNDLLIGGTGDNDLRGFGGNDTLVDGHGSDTLTGGTGADTFVFGADGQRDEIRDFEAGIDRIDLSAVPMMYDASRLSVVEQSWGATLIIPGNEQIEIRSADGGRLIVDQIFASLDWETDRPPLILLNEEAIDEGTNVLIDGDGSTVLEGSSAGDTIQGMGGNDTISGMGGNDVLHGGGGEDHLDGGIGNDSVYGDTGEDHFPVTCGQCGSILLSTAAAGYTARQVFDLPEPQPLVAVEHRAHSCLCGQCGETTKAAFPQGVAAPVQYGPRIASVSTYLKCAHFLPEERLSKVMADLFNAPLATAPLAAMAHKAAERFRAFSTHLCEQISEKAGVKHLDETGFRIGGKMQWLHVACTPLFAFYRVSSKRGSLLTDLSGCIVHDHWKPYFTLDNVIHALCNAHHLRELQALIDIEKEDWAGQMQRLLRRAHHVAQAAQNQNVAVSDRLIALVGRRYDKIIAHAVAFHEAQPALSRPKPGKRGRKKRRTGHNLALRLREHKEGTLRFLVDPDVPFTNNEAERDLRMMKLRQKISGGFRSQQGAEDFAILRSLITTARKQGWNIIETLMKTADQLIADLKYA